jgi:hypothetical protein
MKEDMRKLTRVALIAVLAAFISLGAVVAHAAIRNVPGTYSTIQAAVNAALSGDTIIVAAGIYDEQVVIDGKNLTLKGAGDTTILRPSLPATLTTLYTYPAGTFWPGTNLSSIILVKNVNGVGAGVTIKNLKVDGVNVTTEPTGADRLAGILFGESAGLVQNVTVNTIKALGGADRTYGIDVSAGVTAVSVEVAGNRINYFLRNGIQAQGVKLTANIHNNTVKGPGATGPGGAVPDLSGVLANGILFIHGVGGKASNNTIHNAHYIGPTSRSAGILVYDLVQPGIVVENNEIYHVDDGVILSAGANAVIVRNNNLHNNADVGVQLEDGATGHAITYNCIIENAIAGIRLNGVLNPDVTNQDPPGTGNFAHFNNISGNGIGVLNYDSNQTFDATRNWWGAANGPGPVGPGSGDEVSLYVDYTNFLRHEADGKRCDQCRKGDNDDNDDNDH